MRSAGLVVVVAAACGKDHGAPVTTGPDAARMIDASVDATTDGSLEPSTLFGTGLCVDEACTGIASGIQSYAPADPYVLWADDASKNRWIALPPGTQIDTSDMNHWAFPVGTKIWKEFDLPSGSDAGPLVRVETRYMVKILDSEEPVPDPWFYVSYQWNSMAGGDLQGTMASAAPSGVTDANGTDHDIPSQSQCKGCHENNVPGRVLGFSAMPLDFHQATAGLLDLDTIIAMNWLTNVPPGSASPHFPFPVDATGSDILALEYAHDNCGECHNPTSPINGQTPILFRLDVNALGSVLDTPMYMTTIGHTGSPLTDTMDPNNNCQPITDPSGGASPLDGCDQVVLADWAPGSAYNFDDRVVANGNAYLCLTKGALGSAGFPCGVSGSAAPSGMGSNIADGTANWEYIGSPLQRSLLIYRFETTNPGKHMPAAGENITDPSGQAIFTAWVTNLP